MFCKSAFDTRYAGIGEQVRDVSGLHLERKSHLSYDIHMHQRGMALGHREAWWSTSKWCNCKSIQKADQRAAGWAGCVPVGSYDLQIQQGQQRDSQCLNNKWQPRGETDSLFSRFSIWTRWPQHQVWKGIFPKAVNMSLACCVNNNRRHQSQNAITPWIANIQVESIALFLLLLLLNHWLDHPMEHESLHQDWFFQK